MLDNVIYLSDVRLSFPHLIEPQKNRNEITGVERISYNCEFLMPASHDGFQQFMAKYSELALEKWKENASAVMQMIQQDRKSRCFGAGEEKINKKTFKPYDGYLGMVFITAGKDTPPQVIQADGRPIDPANTMAYQQLTREMFGGCRVNAAIKPWVQDNKHGRGIRCDLVAIQFLRKDTPFGEAPVDVTNIFGAVAQPVAPATPGFVMPPIPGFLGGN